MVTHYFHLSNESKCLKSVSSKQHLLTMSPLKCQSKKKRKKSSSYSGGPKKEQSLITATQFPKAAILAALLKASPTHTMSQTSHSQTLSTHLSASTPLPLRNSSQPVMKKADSGDFSTGGGPQEEHLTPS